MKKKSYFNTSKFALVQGRLVDNEKKNEIKFFPHKNWKKELKIFASQYSPDGYAKVTFFNGPENLQIELVEHLIFLFQSLVLPRMPLFFLCNRDDLHPIHLLIY